MIARRWLLSTTLFASALLTRCSADPRVLVWDRYDTGVAPALPDAAASDTGDAGVIDPCAFCALPHARASCENRVCVVLTCDDGYADCDRVASNGCEASLTSAQHCGACGRSCEGSSCNMGTCDNVRVVQLALGSQHSCALRNNHTVTCWGRNNLGQLGNGTTAAASQPVNVISLNDAQQITASQADSRSVTCARTNTTVACWGSNESGQFGNGTRVSSASPVRLSTTPGEVGLVEVSAGHGHICGRPSAEEIPFVFCWGDNAFGQIGIAQTTMSATRPTLVRSLTNLLQVRAGGDHTCAILRDESTSCWGRNTSGQLGNGSLGNASAPAPVSALTNASELALGALHTCARRTDGSAWCWGDNTAGQLGDGTVSRRPTPTQVRGLENVRSIAAGAAHTCAVRADGAVLCWGKNLARELGDGTSLPQRLTPTPVVGLPAAAVEIATGAAHTCARLVDHRVYLMHPLTQPWRKPGQA